MVMRWLILNAFAAAALCSAAEPSFRLGVDYSRRFDSIRPGAYSEISAAATDRAGALYVLGFTTDDSGLSPTSVLAQPSGPGTCYLLKFAPSGDRVEYLAILGFRAWNLAVDSVGNAYVAGDAIAKVNAAGTAFVYRLGVPGGATIQGLAVDSSGRAYFAGTVRGAPFEGTWNAYQKTAPNLDSTNVFVGRINAVWSTFDWLTYVAGPGWDYASGLAVDGDGSVFVTGRTNSLEWPVTPGAYMTARETDAPWEIPFLTRLSADGSRVLYSTFLPSTSELPEVAVDAHGSAMVLLNPGTFGTRLLRFNAAGGLEGDPRYVTGARMVADFEGRAYVTGYTVDAGAPRLKHNIQACVPDELNGFVSVVGPDGESLQSTYVPSAGFSAVSPSGFVYLVSVAPTSALQVVRLSRQTDTRTVKLGCVSSAANTYVSGRVAPGEMVSVFGEGLLGVTFNGVPAALLYVSDTQLNAVVPWSVREGSSVEICSVAADQKTNCLTRQVVAAEPRVFMINGDYAAALNEDGSVNSKTNPAAPDSVVSIFATGLGRVVPTPVDGSLNGADAGTNVLQTRIGVITTTYGFMTSITSTAVSDPVFAGPAPGRVAGISLIRVRATAKPMVLYLGDWDTREASGQFRVYVSEPPR